MMMITIIFLSDRTIIIITRQNDMDFGNVLQENNNAEVTIFLSFLK